MKQSEPMAKQRQPAWSEYVPDPEGQQQLEHHVFTHRHGPRDFLPPPRIRPEVVRQFIAARFEPGLPPDGVQRLGDVVRFYVLSDLARKFLLPLERRERTPVECLRSIACVRVLGDAGDNSQQQFAGEYFDYLAGHAAFPDFAGSLVESYFSLGPLKTPDKLEARLDAEIQRLLPQQQDREFPQGQCGAYVQQRENALPLIATAKAHKDKLLIEPDNLKRATGWARLYLGLDDPGGVPWGEAAGYALLAEAQRSDRETVIAGLRAALGALKPSEREDYLQFARQRGARAVAYLGGALTADELEWLGEMPVRRHLLSG
jgi:hypothetical protein